MKLIFNSLLVALCVGIFSSCSKKDDAADQAKPEDVAKANEFKTYVSEKKFVVSEYYSDKPIDYKEDDAEIKQETDLWAYVSNWIKDDDNLFVSDGSTMQIYQNQSKISGNDSTIITRRYFIGADKNGPYLDFVNHEYKPLRYRLVEFTNDYFLVYVDWHSGAKVFSKFIKKP